MKRIAAVKNGLLDHQQQVMLVIWVVMIGILSGNVERQAFKFLDGQNYPQYWLSYVVVLLMWLTVIPVVSGRNIDYLFTWGMAFIFQLVEDWSYWIWSGSAWPRWFPLRGVIPVDLPFIDLPFFYYLDLVIGIPLIVAWVDLRGDSKFKYRYNRNHNGKKKPIRRDEDDN